MSFALLRKFFISLLVLVLTVGVKAQDKGDDWFDDEDSFHNFNVDFSLHGNPTIEMNYGSSASSFYLLNGKFNKAKMAELKLGYTSEHNVNGSESLMKYSDKYFGLTNLSYKLSKSTNAANYDGDIWRFSIGWDHGYGYKPGQKSAIILYNGSALTWSNLKLNTLATNPADSAMLGLFTDSYKFGQKTEGGMKIQIIPQLVVSAGFERAEVYSKVMFWKWAGSAIIEIAGQAMLDEFIDKIMDSTPAAAPIINFLLKNGLSYGIYELRKEKMNWPFNTQSPLLTDSYKFGLTLIF